MSLFAHSLEDYTLSYDTYLTVRISADTCRSAAVLTLMSHKCLLRHHSFALPYAVGYETEHLGVKIHENFFYTKDTVHENKE